MKLIGPSAGIDRRSLLSTLALVPAFSALLPHVSALAQTAGPLPSWNDGTAKQAIVNFVDTVTRDGSPNFVPPPERIAVFDNDGTLWCEHPIYVQLAFALDRVKAMAPMRPEWKDKQPFKAVLEGDMKTFAASGEHGAAELVMATHAGMTTEEFSKIVTDWLATARHPRFNRPYTELVYQPMLELLAYLRLNGFKTFIVSGGGIDFIRPWAEKVYGIPPEQVVGSSIKTRYETQRGRPLLFRLPEVNFIDDGAGKPVGIHQHIGRRPIAAFGNSDGDLQMLQWTTMSGGVRFGLVVHHTDAEREYAYDRETSFGRLDKALDAAALDKWTVVDMKRDWKVVFAGEALTRVIPDEGISLLQEGLGAIHAAPASARGRPMMPSSIRTPITTFPTNTRLLQSVSCFAVIFNRRVMLGGNERMSSDAARMPGAVPGPPMQVGHNSFNLATAWRIRSVRLIVYFGMLLTAAIAAAGHYIATDARDNVLADTKRELQNVAAVFAEHFERTFEALNLTQLSFVQHVQGLDITSVDAFEAQMAGRDVHLMLRDRIANLLPVHAFLLASARGTVVNFSRDWPAPAGNIAGEDYFKELVSSPDLASYIGAPTRNPASGRWSFHVAHRLIGADREFLGVLVGVMELRYFEQLFAAVELGRGSSIALVRRDGRVLARYPQFDMTAAPSFAGNPLFKDVLPRDGKGVVRLTGRFDTQERLIAGHNLVRHPAAVSVGMDIDGALADWRKGAVQMVGIAGLTLLVIVGMILLCARHIGIDLYRQKFKLDTALNNMSHGLCMFDAAGVLTIHNARYLEIFNIPPGLIEPGCTLHELLARLKDAGIVTGDQDKYAADVLAAIAAGRTTQVSKELKDGRIISVTNRPLPDGGWVSTHEDVTELRRHEEELRLENMKFDAALQNMSQGLVMFDSDSKLIVCNQKYAELYDLPSELIKPGVTQKQILEHRLARGIIAPANAAQYVAERTAKAAAKAPSDTILELSDGRTLMVALRPLPNGGWVTTHEDITSRRKAEAQIAHMAHHDALTNLPNRVLLRERLEEALGHIHRGGQLAVLYLDLDHFKSINDTLGHGIGDELLKAVAVRLRGCVRETDTIARLGGDEFAIIQTGFEQLSDVAALASRIREVITPPYELDGHQVPADVSIGISIAPSDTSDPEQLLKNADMALYRSKADGRGTFRFFELEMDERVKARRTLELDLRKAIVNGEFELYYQPLVNLERHEIICCESLLRWHHPTRGMVPPIEFISLAEETGLINQIGEWVLRQACAEAATWPDDIAVAVNLSPTQFKNHNLVALVVSALAASGLPARRLEVEITEAVLMQNNEATLTTLHQLRELGVHIAMDDFGTGYSSLSYLRSFPFDKIKIDRSFISDIADKEDSSAIVQAVTDLAGRLRITTTAEGVETQGQLELVQALGCTEMQGYLYSRAVPAKEIVRLFPRAIRRQARD